ncbi:MAG: glycoside hydrolase family 28 protein [Verrucomicrobiota bacterium]
MNPNRLICLLSLVAVLVVLSSRGADARLFDVREYGAKGDGNTVDTAAVQKALDACGKAGGGTVLFPAGIYLSQPIKIKDKTTLKLEAKATLKATDDPADFRGSSPSNYTAFITGKNLESLTITGPGTIDGSGAKWWEPAEEARRKTPGYTLPRPNLIVLTSCKNVRVENITLQNSPKFHLVPTDCDGVVISNVTITAPPRSANTDAIDPSASRHVLITHCKIDVGDDNVAIKAGKKMEGREFATEDIEVAHCTFLHGHGMSIGSEVVGGVKNVRVHDCTFEGTENGIRIKSQRGRGGLVEDISYSNITMKNVDPAITFTCFYMFNSKGDPTQPAAPAKEEASPSKDKVPVYRNIRVTNLKATCTDSAGVILGLPDSRIENVALENVQITAATTGLKIQNASGIDFKNVNITPKTGPAVITENAQVTGLAH